ncbi:MAG: hypothetical protein ACJ8F7_22865, partial [Gemmataceae bacterium]
MASAVNGTIQFKTAYLVKVDPSAADTEGRLEVRQKKGCALTHGTNPAAPAGKGAEQLTGVNPKYAFQIHRAAESSDWVLDSIDVGGDGSRLPFVSPLTQSEKARAAVCDNFQLERPLTLERLFGMPNLRITRSTIVTLDSVEMVRIEFTCLPSPEKPKDRLSVILGGHLILDPRHYWCIKECSYRTDDSMSKRTFLSQFE